MPQIRLTSCELRFEREDPVMIVFRRRRLNTGPRMEMRVFGMHAHEFCSATSRLDRSLHGGAQGSSLCPVNVRDKLAEKEVKFTTD